MSMISPPINYGANKNPKVPQLQFSVTVAPDAVLPSDIFSSLQIKLIAQWLRRLAANRKVNRLLPALPNVLRARDISNLCSHTVHSAECTGNCA